MFRIEMTGRQLDDTIRQGADPSQPNRGGAVGQNITPDQSVSVEW